ncbi:alkaline phosphatase family protein [Mycobacterium sp. NPDC048908]|uniref:alkaline phosphatase family protein n=1 Tax=Mycobacterium sp. NPDC048908 TaxID=3364292 RepID=UPI003713E457
MGCAKHIGRVGALAVTLGVGVAVATTPGIAYAGPADPASSGDTSETTTSSATDTSTSPPKTAPKKKKKTPAAAATESGDDDKGPAADPKPSTDADGTSAAANEGNDDDAGQTPTAETSPAGEDDNHEPVTENSGAHKASKPLPSPTPVAGVVTSVPSLTSTARVTRQKVQTPVADAPVRTFSAPPVNDPGKFTATTFTTLSSDAAPAVPLPRPTLISVVSDVVAAALQPLLSWGTGSPLQVPVLWAMVSAVRDELERNLFRRTSPLAAQQPTTLLDPVEPDQHVLVIGIDGTNLSRVMADPTNENFFDLMDDSTNSAPSIVGHTTISNPSWTAILTGAWDNKTGVINNVYTPWTYDKWPTVFTQLETYNSAIDTKAIADWAVIAAIAASGVGADDVHYVAQLPGDTNWSATDAAVTAEAVKSIRGTEPGYEDVPEFLFTYLVQVDENGHMFGGASEQYKEAIQRTDDNLGAIMEAVTARETATGEKWTVIVVTDHGHQPQQGFGHGFQSPDETATFVIARGPDFGDGDINTDYQIVDVTPTVLDLFDAPLRRNFDGLPLTSLGTGVDPGDRMDLQDALKAQLASNHAPDFFTNVALSARTIFAFIPFFVQDADLPAPIGDILYVVTNVPAQIVAFLTGVHGASIFPLLPPPPASSFIPDQSTTLDCGEGTPAAAACLAS